MHIKYVLKLTLTIVTRKKTKPSTPFLHLLLVSNNCLYSGGSCSPLSTGRDGKSPVASSLTGTPISHYVSSFLTWIGSQGLSEMLEGVETCPLGGSASPDERVSSSLYFKQLRKEGRGSTM